MDWWTQLGGKTKPRTVQLIVAIHVGQYLSPIPQPRGLEAQIKPRCIGLHEGYMPSKVLLDQWCEFVGLKGR